MQILKSEFVVEGQRPRATVFFGIVNFILLRTECIFAVEIGVLREDDVTGSEPEMTITTKQRVRSRKLKTGHALLIKPGFDFVVRKIEIEATGLAEDLGCRLHF